MSECLFCKIINKEIPADIVYEDDVTLAFNDINPEAPHHILVIPKKHYAAIHDIGESDKTIGTELFNAIKKIVIKQGLTENGYRLIVNCGEQANQTIGHIHVHILSGRSMQWPPG